jgi:hypothetical protein
LIFGASLYSDANGRFKLVVPVGRIDLKFSYVGYEEANVSQIQVIAGKETFVNIELRESVSELEEIVVKANKNLPLNTMATVSARMISTEDATRYAAGYFDPSRMVSSFAGVSAMEGDGKNDIIIRGNSPRGLLWRLEGIEIPSPNHFGDGPGDSGGAFCIISSDVLANSDFYTGAFPSEYGNALSGILDLNLRKGNPDKMEYGITAGIVGTSASIEGPIKAFKDGSFLINYRYANFKPLDKLGVVDFGDNAYAPVFQDLVFNFNMPTAKSGTFEFFGVGGMSTSGHYGIKDSLIWTDENDLGDDDTENHRMAAVGLKHTITLPNKQTYLKTTFSGTYLYDRWDQGFLGNEYKRTQYFYSNYEFPTLKADMMINHKFNAVHTLRAGINYSNLYYNMYQRINYPWSNIHNLIQVDEKGSTGIAEAYIQWKYRLTENFELNTGLHATYFLLSKHNSLEPRLGLKYQISKNSSINYGFGIHSKIEPLSAYLAYVPFKGDTGSFNKNANFTRAIHNVLGYDLSITSSLRLKAEVYYQYLYDIPIYDNPDGWWSAVNATFGVPEVVLSNKGKGYNKGLELTLEKFYTNDYYYLITISLYDSKYRAGNHKLYNSYFNGNYVTNWLLGKDFKMGRSKQNILGINLKTLVRGGLRYPDFTIQTRNLNLAPYSKQMADFLRFDMGLKFRQNKPGYSWIVSLDVQNLLNKQNELEYRYNSDDDKLYVSWYSIGMIPILNFKVEF